MENALLLAVALLPLGLVAIGAAMLIKNKLNKKPELRLVTESIVPPAQPVISKKKSKKKKGKKNARKN